MSARQRQRLSARSIHSKPPGRHADGDGLMLQVTKNASRSWVLRTMVRGKRADIGLGGFPLISLAEARDEAIELRKIARRGGDPVAERAKAQKSAPLFNVAATAVHAEHQGSWKSRKHAHQWITTLQQYVIPSLGETRVDEIFSEHVVKALSPIWLTKPETARRVLQRLRTVLLWAKGHGHRSDSPTDVIAGARRALPPQTARAGHHKALPYDDVPQFIVNLRTCGASDQIKLAFEFLILTTARTNEVLGATWPEIDLRQAVWVIPAERMKAKREHRVPLCARAIEILQLARTLNEDRDGFVFPGTIARRSLSDMVFLMVLRRMGVDVTAHGFRSSFRVWCAEKTSFPREVAEAALAHVLKDATEAAYMRSTFFEKRRQLMQEWADFATF